MHSTLLPDPTNTNIGISQIALLRSIIFRVYKNAFDYMLPRNWLFCHKEDNTMSLQTTLFLENVRTDTEIQQQKGDQAELIT